MRTKQLRVSDLKHDMNNVRKHNVKNIRAIQNSLEAFGQQKPIVIDKNSIVVAGNGTLEAAKNLGWEKISVVVTELSQKNIKAYAIGDNRSGELAEWDVDKLNTQLFELNDIDFNVETIGFTVKDIDVAAHNRSIGYEDESGKTEDDIPELEENIFGVRLGDIYQLGSHKIMCGDSTDKEQVDKLIDGYNVDMVYTDPPYGINLDTDYSKIGEGKVWSKRDNKFVETGKKNYKKIKNDGSFFDVGFILDFFLTTEEIFIWGGDYFSLPTSCLIVWDRTGGQDKYDRMFGSSFEICWSKQKHKRHVCHMLWKGFYGVADDTNAKGKNAKVHPTQKPVKLHEWFFGKWGKEKDNVVDLFLGSGSTLIACEKTDRQCFGMELDPHYCSVIIERWQNYTGDEAVLVERNGKEV